MKYFGGVPKIIQCDNLKTGVLKHGKDEVEINRAYQELAEHYNTAIIPARVRASKDKAFVEGTVGVISTFILAALRNQQFLSLKAFYWYCCICFRILCVAIIMRKQKWKVGCE